MMQQLPTALPAMPTSAAASPLPDPLPDPLPFAITHDVARQCFECQVDGLRCSADYRLAGGVMHMTHTGVPRALEGRGIAAALVAAAFAHARAQGLKVNPLCSYVSAYMQRHPETQALAA